MSLKCIKSERGSDIFVDDGYVWYEKIKYFMSHEGLRIIFNCTFNCDSYILIN